MARRDPAVASLNSLMRRVEDRSRASGQSLDEASAVVVEELERAAAALNTRTAPLVPGCGVLVAVIGVLLKAEPTSDRLADVLLSLAILFAVPGFLFLVRALFVYAGRHDVGLSPVVADIAYARDNLVRKYAAAHHGGWLVGAGMTCLVLGLLFSVHFTVGTG